MHKQTITIGQKHEEPMVKYELMQETAFMIQAKTEKKADRHTQM